MSRPTAPLQRARHGGPRGWRFAACVLVALASGCAIQEQVKTNVALEQGNAQKEAELQRLQSQNQALRAENLSMQADLKAREMSAAELTTRLNKLKDMNEHTAAANEEERRRRSERTRQIDQAASEAKAIESNRNLSEAEKRRKLDALREKTRQMLQLLLVS